MQLQRAFTSFPTGPAGIALLALRAAVGATAALEAGRILIGGHAVTYAVAVGCLCAIVAGVALLIGYLTPFVSAMLCAEGACLMCVRLPVGALSLLDSHTATIALCLTAAALIALGPGAISLDARVFGRREIAIPAKKPPAEF
jgi:uncharacterized membrane protein YphA (DoxX/SURF4 family)